MAEVGSVFDLLAPEVKKLVLKRFREPTPIQQAVIPRVLEGKNVLVISETGSGKTESCLLPIFNSLAGGEKRPISVLYITPLRSLNRDLQKRILWWSRELGFDTSVRHGDTSQYERSMQAANPPHLMVSTPETLQAILVGKVMREHLRNVRYVVVDEIHELVGSKRGVQLAAGLARLNRLIREGGRSVPQVIGLSATIGSPEGVARFLAGEGCEVVNAVKLKELEIKVECPEPEKGDTEVGAGLFISPALAARLRVISDYIKSRESVLVFTNTRESAEVLSSRLKALDPELGLETHHSSLSREVRVQAEEDFKQEKLKAMVATSSLELGIDIGSIDFTLQYTSPRQVAKLLQRVGRSGHTLERVSSGVILTSDAEDSFESAVIARQALKGLVEPARIYSGALDVLANQVVGLALEEWGIPFSKAFDVVRQAAPFSGLTKERFLSLCEFVQRLGFVWIDNQEGELVLKRRKRAWQHYYSNLSTIPDVRNYRVIDITSNQPVGSLDAEFVALHGSPGTNFICRGRAWRILDVTDRITVEPVRGVEGAIPAWEGELIPIPFQVAQEVGRLRAELAARSREEGVKHLVERYPVAQGVAEKMAGKIKEQERWGPVPSDKEVLVEHGRQSGSGTRLDYRESFDYVIFHTCFGSSINETLGRTLSILLMSRLGSVGFKADPYRIVLKFPAGTGDVEGVLKVFRGLDPKTVKGVLETALPNTELFSWRFLHVAKRFGVISRDADFGKGYLNKIVEVYSGTPLYKEALNEVWQEKLNLEGAGRVLEQIKKGEVTFTVKPGLSPLGQAGLISRYEIIASARPEKEVLETVKQRLFHTRVRLLCCHCGWGINYPVKELPEELKCLACGARLMGVIKPAETEKERLLKKFLNKKPLTKEEMDIVNGVMNTAGLIISSGHKAVLVLAGRGIGPKTASRILARMSEGDELVKDILEAERTFARTKRFWSD